MTAIPDVTGFYDERTGSIQYVVADPGTGKCAIIDPVLDYDEKLASTATTHADNILEFIPGKGYGVEWIRDTHPHADHFTAAAFLRAKTGAPTAIGEKVVAVQRLWRDYYNGGPAVRKRSCANRSLEYDAGSAKRNQDPGVENGERP